ncbi:type II toxin-antitoxin system prevent-host-death family antitoxin [Georgenia sp. EYE_87]|uniref:type II toxin-antitoxin system Phd/YefM family antitoxin n=1 Tax=Georgenia sp. EYE_87 TaxID=2853448 RepID=UPI002003B5BD|nr:type II toxin-antitoxin system prevent-host-death family antitoxin [Georgenia sp. EYE_87]MCK6211574.1 type II toxin-antitoxin system prevent-host-death family antitoxin [Georgenia sp. EYE_87]
MASVGIRALKAQLSSYVERARSGEVVVVTDHGRPVAQLTPITGESVLERLVSEGLAVRPAGAAELPVPIRATGTVSDLVGEQRR